MLTQKELKDSFVFNERTGVFSRKASKQRPDRIGKSLTTTDSAGYVSIYVCGKTYRGHRLAWLYMHGKFPEAVIDHINGIRSDNRIENLRATAQQNNTFNSKKHLDNYAGIKGVSKVSGSKTWRARASINGRIFLLGTFRTKEEAGSAYEKFAKENHGEFFHSDYAK